MDLEQLIAMLGIGSAQAAPRVQEYPQPGPRLDLAAQAQPPVTLPMPPALTSGSPAMPDPTLAPMPSRPVEPYMTDPLAGGQPQVPVPTPQPAGLPSLGASLEPNPTGYATNPWSKEGILGSGSVPKGTSSIADSLKGVVTPQAPQAQKVSTPHAPTLAKLPGGNVAELLAQLGIGPQQAFPGLKLPSTLGQALGGR